MHGCIPACLAPTDCSSFFAEQYALPYTASTDLSVLMLNNFLNFLDQTDVTQVTWAQYMDVTCCNGTGLLDYYGNARPSWHSFKFWGDIPTERVVSLLIFSRNKTRIGLADHTGRILNF